MAFPPSRGWPAWPLGGATGGGETCGVIVVGALVGPGVASGSAGVDFFPDERFVAGCDAAGDAGRIISFFRIGSGSPGFGLGTSGGLGSACGGDGIGAPLVEPSGRPICSAAPPPSLSDVCGIASAVAAYRF